MGRRELRSVRTEESKAKRRASSAWRRTRWSMEGESDRVPQGQVTHHTDVKCTSRRQFIHGIWSVKPNRSH